MKNKIVNVILRVILAVAIIQLPTIAAETKQPNIVLLFSDDAGYADFGFQGSKHFKTPKLDAMCAKGIKLNQMYVTAAVCGPSRAGLLTGQYQQRYGFEENNVPGYMSESGQQTGDEMGLPLGIPTVADYLKKLGYRSAIFGKWHMGNADCYHPLNRGFDEFVGFRGGSRSFYAYCKPDETVPENLWEHNFKAFKEPEGYLTDVIADEACAFIERNQDRPFFAYVSFNAVHTPMEPDPKYAGLYPELKGKRRNLAQMNQSLDDACGKIYDKLEELGLLENTLIVFSNDNGGPTDASRANNYPLSGTKANHLEGGIRVPGFVIWKGKLNGGTEYPYPVSTLDLLPTFVKVAGGNLANVDKTDGVDLLPYLQSRVSERPHEVLFWKKENRGAIRSGDWKLLRYPDRPAELYDLSKDPSENHDLASVQSGLVRQLYKQLFAWELELERPKFMLKRYYEGKAMERMDAYRSQEKDPLE